MTPHERFADGIFRRAAPAADGVRTIMLLCFIGMSGLAVANTARDSVAFAAFFATLLLLLLVSVVGPIWRLLDGRDRVIFDEDGILFHPSLGPALLQWEQIRRTAYKAVKDSEKGTIHCIVLNLTFTYRGWGYPLGSRQVWIDFDTSERTARDGKRLIDEYRRAAGWAR